VRDTTQVSFLSTLTLSSATPCLVFLSKGCGSIYSLQFTLQPSGKPYFTYDEVKSYINLLTSGNGLWDKERLLSSETTEGSLKNVAASIGKRYGLTLDDIKHSN